MQHRKIQFAAAHGHLAFYGAYVCLNLALFTYALPILRQRDPYNQVLNMAAFWLMSGGMLFMTFVLTFAVLSVQITAPGGGFSEAPAVTFSGGSAAATSAIDIVLEPKHTFEHQVKPNPGGIINRTAIILGPGDRLYAQADTDTVALTAWGVSALI